MYFLRCGSEVGQERDLRASVQKVLCSEGSMFRQYLFKRFYLQKVLYSEGPTIRRFCVQKVLYSEGPMFRRSYVQKKIIQKVLYSEGSMFRRSYIQIYSEGTIFRKFSHFSSLGQRSDELLSWRVVCRLSVHNLPKSL